MDPANNIRRKVQRRLTERWYSTQSFGIQNLDHDGNQNQNNLVTEHGAAATAAPREDSDDSQIISPKNDRIVKFDLGHME